MPDHPPICPNCDYDLTGQVATWSTQCPLKGQCPECGIGFEWSYVYKLLAQWDSSVDWYAEHATSLKQYISRTPGTFLRLTMPWLFFKDINHRRTTRLRTLTLWIILLTIMIHIPVSIIGYPKFNDEASGSITTARANGLWYGHAQEAMLDSFNAILFPYTYLLYDHDRYLFIELYWSGEWEFLSGLSIACGAITLVWIAVTSLSIAVYSNWKYSWRQLARVALLSLVPPLVYLQIVRFIHGYDYVTGKSEANLWLIYLYVASLFIMIVWQHLIWAHAIHKLWRFKPSWPINIIGIAVSTICGFASVFLFL